MRETPKIKPGDRFGKLTVVEATSDRKNRCVVWSCRCDCGKEVLFDTHTLRRGTWQSCGCDRRVKPGMTDLTGRRFGRLVCVAPTGESRRNWGAAWFSKCDCGNEIVSYRTQLQNGSRRSCGCLNSELARERLGAVEGTSVRQLEIHRGDHISKHNTSGFTGVTFHRQTQKWVAQIQFKKKKYYLGIYSNIEDAKKARALAEEKLFDGFLNWYFDQRADEAGQSVGAI